MRTLTLTNNKRLVLAGIIAFAIILVSQVSVMAYDFVGGLNRSTPTIGFNNKILVIGFTTLPDSSLNIGQMPSVTTGTVTNLGDSVAGLSGTITSMGVASDTYTSFEYGDSVAYGSTTVENTANVPSTFTGVVSRSPIKEFHYRARVRVGSVYSYGADQLLAAETNTTNSVNFILPLGLLVILIFVIKGLTEGLVEVSPIVVILLIAVVAAIIQMIVNVFTSLF